MLIRCGYEITLTCPQPTALVCLLSVHEERSADIRGAETHFTQPDVPVSTYVDMFGNRCRRLVAPTGDFMMWATRPSRTTASWTPSFPRRAKRRYPTCPTTASAT